MSNQWAVNHISTPKNVRDIVKEWDAIAEARMTQIDSGLDSSFERILCPAILGKLAENNSCVLDIGCGTGALSQRIAQIVRHIVAIDPSLKSIDLARVHHPAPNLQYIDLDAEKYLQTNPDKINYFDAVVANMVLMDVVDVQSVLNSAYELCSPQGFIFATITHPCFWPKYWSYENASWFEYSKEIQIEAPFRISAGQLPVVTTHVHRPMEKYFEAFYAAGFHDVCIQELGEIATVDSFSSKAPVNFPKFLMFTALKREASM